MTRRTRSRGACPVRRYAPLKPSSGTRIPNATRHRVVRRDRHCVLADLWPHLCQGALELDHVRASGGLGMKSVTCDCNLVALCGTAHRYKTANGREVRPLLLGYLARFEYEHHDGHAA